MKGESDQRKTLRGKLLRFPASWSPFRVRLRFRFTFRFPWEGRHRRFRRLRADARPKGFLSDARRMVDLPKASNPDPEHDRRGRLRTRSIALGLAALFFVGVLASIFGSRGYRDVQKSRLELEELREKLDVEQERVLALRRDVQRLRDDPTAIERIAREELGFVKPGEITFLLMREEPPAEVGKGRPDLSQEPRPPGRKRP